MRQKLLVWLLCAVMILTMPGAALAAEGGSSEKSVSVSQTAANAEKTGSKNTPASETKKDTASESGAQAQKPAAQKNEEPAVIAPAPQKKDSAQNAASKDSSDAANPQSKTADPQSKTADPQFNTADPQSKTADPQSKTADPQSNTADPQSKTADPQSNTADLQSGTVDPQSKASDPQPDPSSDTKDQQIQTDGNSNQNPVENAETENTDKTTRSTDKDSSEKATESDKKTADKKSETADEKADKTADTDKDPDESAANQKKASASRTKAAAGQPASYAVDVSAAGSSMYQPQAGSKAYIAKQTDGTFAARITMVNGRSDRCAIGSKEDIESHKVDWYKNEGDADNSAYTIPIPSLDTCSVSNIYFRNSNTGNWSTAAHTYTFDASAKQDSDVSVVIGAYVDKATEETPTPSPGPGNDPTPVPGDDSWLDYTGETVTCIKADGSEFGMYRPQDGTKAELKGDKVNITYYPNNTTVYTRFGFGLITDENVAVAAELNNEKAFVLSVDKSYCGHAVPIKPLKSTGETTGSQYYLAVPSESVLNGNVTPAPDKTSWLDYDGFTLTCIKADGSEFGMYRPQDGTKAELKGDKVNITYYPNNTTVYTSFGFGLITDENVVVAAALNDDKVFVLSVDKSYCGHAVPIKPLKSTGETTGSQYYLAVPSEDVLNGNVTPPPSPDDPTPVPEGPTPEPGKEAASYAVAVSVTGGQMYVAKPGSYAYIAKQKDGTYAAKITLINGRADMAAIGTAKQVEKHAVDWYKNEGDSNNSVFVVPVPSMDSSVNLYFRNLNTGNWSSNAYQYTFSSKTKKTASNVKVVLGKNVLKGSGETGGEEEEEEEDKPVDTDPTPLKAYKIVDGEYQEYLMIRVTSYEAVTDGKLINAKFYTTHETYAQKMFFGTVSQISSIKSCYARAKDTSFCISVPYSQKGKMVPFVICTEKGWKAEQYYLQIPTEPKTTKKTLKEAPQVSADGSEIYKPEEPGGGGTNGTTDAVDNSTRIADGIYKPDSFSFSGGTGKMQISCSQIEIKGGQAYATLHFSSTKVPYIKANGGTYYLDNQNVTIPVSLNRNMTILALTTAMSQPHEIAYQIYIGLKAAAAAAGEDDISVVSTVGEGYGNMDTEAPQIAGLAAEKVNEDEQTDLMKIFRYKDGEGRDYTLIEVDMVTGTANDPALKKDSKPEASDAEEPETEASDTADSKPEASGTEDSAPEENASGTGNTITDAVDEEAVTAAEEQQRTADEQRVKLYSNGIIKYLVVPEGGEVPVGLDTMVVVIKQPVQNVYASGAEELTLLDQSGAADPIAFTGIEKAEDMPTKEFKEAMEKEKIVYGGTYDDLKLKELIKAKTGLLIFSAEILPEKEEESEAYYKTIEKLANHAVQLGMPFIVNRSGDEKTKELSKKWEILVSAIFGSRK